MLNLRTGSEMRAMNAVVDRKMNRELRTLARFIQIYCDDLHRKEPRQPLTMRTHDVRAIAGREIVLCPSCSKLLQHAFTKRSNCPMDPKPMCKDCPKHCYAPNYRAEIRTVMRHSGKKMLLHGRLDYLLHLFF